MRAYPEWIEADVIASCRKCRCLVVLRKHANNHRRVRLINPYASDRVGIAVATQADATQGFQVPGGFTHSRCTAFDWTHPRPTEHPR